MFSLNSGFITLPNDTDTAEYLKNLARLLAKVPDNTKVENLIPQLKSVYYSNDTATEEGTTDVSISSIWSGTLHPCWSKKHLLGQQSRPVVEGKRTNVSRPTSNLVIREMYNWGKQPKS